MNQRTALLVGATGLIGGHCLQLLANDESYEKVIILVRKPTAFIHPKVHEHVVNFDKLDNHTTEIAADDVFCCLGTTMKLAGSREAFRKVDFTYPVQVGAIAAKNGADQFLIVTALGADPHSRVFYNRVKGETEQSVAKLPLGAIHIFRPSLLLGDRKDSRFVETVAGYAMSGIAAAMAGPLRKYRPIEARVVAEAMLLAARRNDTGINIYESDRIQSLYESA